MTSYDAASPDGLQTFALLQTLLVGVEEIGVFMQELATLAARVLAPPVSVGITSEHDGHPLTVASSDAQAAVLDETQYDVGDGPCITSMRSGEAIHVVSVAEETRWPVYMARAREAGVTSSLSLPLVVEGSSVGAVNFYSLRAGQTFDSSARGRADQFTAQASTALLLAGRQLKASQTNRQLETALSSRSVIDQAIGIIMAQQACSPDAAFDMLRRHSQNSNRRLREIAADLVHRIGGS